MRRKFACSSSLSSPAPVSARRARVQNHTRRHRRLWVVEGLEGRVLFTPTTYRVSNTSNERSLSMTKRTKRSRRPMVESLEGRALLTAGTLDTTFGGTGMVSTNLDSTGDIASAVAVQPDSKVVVVGQTGYDSGSSVPTSHIAVVRYNADGSLDTTFGTGGMFIDPFGTNVVEQDTGKQTVAIQGDGKIVVVGTEEVAITTKTGKKTTTTDYTDWLIFRLNPNGTLDTSFGSGGQVITPFGSSVASSVAIQPTNGKIVVAGAANPSTTGGYAEFTVARYNTDGSLDTTFGSGGIVRTDVSQILGATSCGSSALSLAIDPSGNIIAAGEAYAYSSIVPIDRLEMAMIRLTAGGTLDTTFGTGGAVAALAPSARMGVAVGVGLQSGGQIILGGLSSDSSGFSGSGDKYELAIARFTPGGTLDTTFGGGSGFFSTPLIAYPESLVVDGNGEILAVGYGYTSPNVLNQNFWVARVLADGSGADSTFGTNGVAEAAFGVNTVAESVALDPAGNIVVTGLDSGSLSEFRTARFLGNATTAPSASATVRVASVATASPATRVGFAPDALIAPLVLDDPDLFASLRLKNRQRG